MKIHYFQRYSEKENVATANTMLLLSRLYSFSSDKFFRFLKSEFFNDSFEPELSFEMQKKVENSIPDAVIAQPSFKIVVETKMYDWFHADQLMNHLASFSNEQYKVMITLAPELMAEKKRIEFEKQLADYNAAQVHPVMHINTTFESIAKAIQDVIDERDYEMQDVLSDYLNYCYTDGLIPVSDSWKYMRMQLAGATIDFNMKHHLYYDNADRNFRAHDYLGLYKGKSVRGIGQVIAIITAEFKSNEVIYEAEMGEVTEGRKQAIQVAIEDGVLHGYDLKAVKHRYFFVDRFYPTDFKKVTPRPPMGSRIFDLSSILEADELPTTQEIAELLKTKTWE